MGAPTRFEDRSSNQISLLIEPVGESSCGGEADRRLTRRISAEPNVKNEAPAVQREIHNSAPRWPRQRWNNDKSADIKKIITINGICTNFARRRFAMTISPEMN